MQYTGMQQPEEKESTCALSIREVENNPFLH